MKPRATASWISLLLLLLSPRPTISHTMSPIATAIATTAPILISDRSGLRPAFSEPEAEAAADEVTSSGTKGDGTCRLGGIGGYRGRLGAAAQVGGLDLGTRGRQCRAAGPRRHPDRLRDDPQPSLRRKLGLVRARGGRPLRLVRRGRASLAHLPRGGRSARDSPEGGRRLPDRHEIGRAS